jgi:hypothetical protein
MNVGTLDRVARAVATALAVTAAVALPLPAGAALALGATSVYLLGTALSGTCLGYRLMGRSTCRVAQPSHEP